ncbi:hypothetical protein CMV_008773 [Castanea mollissima]|uniref:Vacuolar iron transporter n=1 Tax=Castanea mollissima TaxID=60419 RepID=A0A8J4RQG5_9ROSI|nr:hypothetical protein CMV_008773 [Castanea mollissima]
MAANQVHDQPSALNEVKSFQVELQTKNDELDYTKRGKWLRTAILGANDLLLSTACLMIGVGAVRTDFKSMILSEVAGLDAAACSMAIGELRDGSNDYMGVEEQNAEKEKLPSPWHVAGASAFSFAV